MDARRALPAIFVAAAALLAAGAALSFRADAPAPGKKEARPALSTTPIVVVPPADRLSAKELRDAASALDPVRGSSLLDEEITGGAGRRARAALEPERPVVELGGPAPAKPDPPRLLPESILTPERVPAGRVFSVTALGAGLDPAKIRVAVDGRESPVTAALRRDGEVEISMGPLAIGPHLVEISAGSGAPVRTAIAAGEPPRIAIAGSLEGAVGRALAAQGFDLADAASLADAKEPPALLVQLGATVDAPIAESWIRRGTGWLVVGSDAIAAAEAGPLAALLPARLLADPLASRPKEPDPEPAKPSAEPPAPPKPAPPQPSTEKPPRAEAPPVAKKSDEAPVVAMALVIDRSGSMADDKIRMAKQAALATSEVLAHDDYITIISFNSTPQLVAPLALVGSPGRIREAVERIPCGGGTAFYSALIMAREQLRRVRASIKHVVLISDGATEDRNTADYRGLLQGDYAGNGITLSTVPILGGGDQDAPFLAQLADWGRGKCYPCSETEIPSLVLTEVRRVTGLAPGATRRDPSDQPAPPTPEPEKPEPPPPPKKKPPPPPPKKPTPAPKRVTPVAEPGSLLCEGLDLKGLAPVEGFAELKPRPGAAVALRSAESGEPLLVLAATEQGAAGVLGIDERRGLDLWIEDPRLRQLLARIATAIGRGEGAREESGAMPFEAVVRRGVLYRRGTDALKLLDGLAAPALQPESGVERARAPAGLRGETRVASDGRRMSSLRIVPGAEHALERDEVLASLRPRFAFSDSGAAGGAAGAPPSATPRAQLLLLAALLCAVAGAVFARRIG